MVFKMARFLSFPLVKSRLVSTTGEPCFAFLKGCREEGVKATAKLLMEEVVYALSLKVVSYASKSCKPHERVSFAKHASFHSRIWIFMVATKEITKQFTLNRAYHLERVVSLVMGRIVYRWLIVFPPCRLQVIFRRWIVFGLLGLISKANKLPT